MAKNQSYDKKIFRLLHMLNSLNSNSCVSSRELAKEFNVSIRTVQRDIDLLSLTGFPIGPSPHKKGAYCFADGFSLKDPRLTSQEASLLAFLYEVAKSFGDTFEESFSSILRKVFYQETSSVFYAKLPRGNALGKKIPFLGELEEAIEDEHVVEFDYRKESRTKWLRVDPLKIAYFDGLWYLIGRVHEQDWILTLRLEYIANLKVLSKTFEVPANLTTILTQSLNPWFSAKRDKTVVLRVDKEVADYFKGKTYFPDQRIVKENKDGSLILESKVCQFMEVEPTIMSWIPHVHVKNPAALKKEIHSRIRAYLA
ncbi:MAG: WYL domain-containing protein [Desulfobacterales bacterium]|nr:WYL domain-containing protein [Desulfobacterales bacterium]